eukprot:m.136667 g.136667  ORF g.136667 m.136667 type:complete len:194 (-) comp15873_c0_seq45:230-811(-)
MDGSTTSTDVPNCSNCEEELALLYCNECDAHFCRACGDVLHKNAKMKQHNIKRIEAVSRMSSTELLDQLPDLNGNDTAADQEPADLDDKNAEDAETTLVPPDTCNLLDWNLRDVTRWLIAQNPDYIVYTETFEKNHIRGKILSLLDQDGLIALGVSADDAENLLTCITRARLEHEMSTVNTMLAEYPRASGLM